MFNGASADGKTLVFVADLASPRPGRRLLPIDADFASGNAVLTVPLAALGLSAGQSFTFTVVAYDDALSGLVTDAIGDMAWTVGAARYRVAEGDNGALPAGASATATVVATGETTLATQSGLLLQYRANAGREFTAVNVVANGV